LRLALLLLGVCSLLHKFVENNSANNGVFKGYKGHQDITGQTSGFVSPFQQPTRHEPGSALQIYYNYNLPNSGNHFRHTFSVIRAKLAEIEAFQNISNIKVPTDECFELYKCAVKHANYVFFDNNNYNYNTFSFSSFHANANVNANNYDKCSLYKLLILRGQIHERFMN
jgi:hypothetical protein